MISTVFYPLVTFVLLLICIAYWAMTSLYPLPTQPALLVYVGVEGRKGRTCPLSTLVLRRHPSLWACTAQSEERAEERAQAEVCLAWEHWHQHLGRPVEGTCRDPVWPCFP